MTDHTNLRTLAGGYVLGALSPEDRTRFEDHLSDCATCRDEVASFAPLPGLLSRAGAEPTPELPPQVVDRAARIVGTEWDALRRSRQRWRRVASLAAALLVLAVALPRLPGGDEPGIRLAVSGEVASGQVSVEHRAWGTAVFLSLEDLPPRDRYVAWVVDGDGNRQQAATWGPTPAGRAVVAGASSLPSDSVVAVVVTDGPDEEVLLVAESS